MQSYSLYIHIHNPFPCPSRLPHRSTSNPFLNYFFLHFLMYTLLRLISLVQQLLQFYLHSFLRKKDPYFLICRDQYSMRHRTPYNSICNQRRRVVEPYLSRDICCLLLLYWSFIEGMFRKLSWTQNLPRYRAGCFWVSWSIRDSCKSNMNMKWPIFKCLYI